MTTRLPLAAHVTRLAQPGELLKRPRVDRARRVSLRGGRETDAAYLDLIRQLPCLKCGLEALPPRMNDPAHVRFNSAAFGKSQAIGKKPSDMWTLSLCRDCHNEQHKIGEHQFWHELGLNPLLVCQDLQRAAPNLVAMHAVAIKWIGLQERVL